MQSFLLIIASSTHIEECCKQIIYVLRGRKYVDGIEFIETLAEFADELTRIVVFLDSLITLFIINGYRKNLFRFIKTFFTKSYKFILKKSQMPVTKVTPSQGTIIVP